MEEYMMLALKEAEKALKKDEVPIGCVIVKNDVVIAKSHNMKEKYKSILEHAELNAIAIASKKLKNWRLIDCDVYVTKQPCDMCMAALKQARVKRVIYGLSNDDRKINKDIELIGGCLEHQCHILIKNFFELKRNK